MHNTYVNRQQKGDITLRATAGIGNISKMKKKTGMQIRTNIKFQNKYLCKI